MWAQPLKAKLETRLMSLISAAVGNHIQNPRFMLARGLCWSIDRLAKKRDKNSGRKEWITNDGQGILQLWLTWNQIDFLFIQVSLNKERLVIIQEVQIISFCLWTYVWFFIMFPGLQVQSQLERTKRTDCIFIIIPLTPIQRF